MGFDEIDLINKTKIYNCEYGLSNQWFTVKYSREPAIF